VKRVTPAVAARLASIAAILLAVTAALAFAGGVFSPGRLGPGAIVDALQVHDGLHPGFRRAHAKGLCIAAPSSPTATERRCPKPRSLRPASFR
jgi:hypothetical protein